MRNLLCRVFTLAFITIITLACNDLFVESTSFVAELESKPLLEVEVEGASSRTAIDEELNISWHADDRIAVFYGNRNNIECRFDGATGDVRGTISAVESIDTGDKHSIDAILAYYPYDANVAINDYEELEIKLQAVQYYAEHGFGRGANPMVAVTESLSHHSLSFRNVCAMLKLQMWGNATIKSITFKGNNQEVLAGEATLIASHDILPDIEFKSSGEKSVTLDCGDGVKLSTNKSSPTDFWIILPPIDFPKGFTIDVVDVEERTFTKSTTKSVSFERNTIQPMAAVEVSFAREIASNEIWYTTTDGAKLDLSSSKFNVAIASQTKDEDMWVVKFNGDITTLNTEAFDSQSRLKSITLPEGVTTIGDYAFYSCTSLKTVNIPSTVEHLGKQVFRYCNAITELTISGMPKSFGTLPFDYSTIQTLTVDCNLDGVALDNGALESDPLFYGASITNIVFTPKVDSIGNYSFIASQSLSSVTMSYGVESVGSGVFMDCKSLTEVTFPESVTSIGDMVLNGCTYLTSVTCLATTPPTLGSNAFPNSVKVHVPEKSILTYKGAPEWQNYRLTNLESEAYVSTDYSKDGQVTALQLASKGAGINVIIMGDGFSDRQIDAGIYESQCRKGMEAMFSEEPFKSFRNLFNVYMVMAVSKYEGIDGEQSANHSVFGSYFGDGTEIIGNDAKVNSYAQRVVTEEQLENTLVIVILNSDYYAGTCYMSIPYVRDPELYYDGYFGDGPAIAYFTTCGDEDTFRRMLMHEACGHGFAKLGDEYYYSGNGEITNKDYYTYYYNLEPLNWYKNVHPQMDGTPTAETVKWSYFLKDERYQYDGLGIFKGGLTYPEGVYRPTEYSFMRSNYGGFNAPSREAIYRRIHYLAYGMDWKYNYEEFVEYDAINRKSAPAATTLEAMPSVVYGEAEMMHCPPKITIR
ncbi:MAG: leucine-rich repeat protein [Alistipes sp.]|nr:leucine-rich repeat protein [Alistipes sp.]